MHPSPHRVPLDASLGSIYQLFRGLGLRFLMVVDMENRVIFYFLFFPNILLCSVARDNNQKGHCSFQGAKGEGGIPGA